MGFIFCLLWLLFFHAVNEDCCSMLDVERVHNLHLLAIAFSFIVEFLVFSSVKCLCWAKINCD